MFRGWQAHLLCSILFLSFLSCVLSQSDEPSPPFIPIALRSPYLNCWINTSNPSGTQPIFWKNSTILGWVGHIRVDGVVYSWLGDDGTTASLPMNTQITPTRTIFKMQAGALNLTITFLSPVESADPVRQSIAFSYVSLEAISNDHQPHSVQVYSDISAEWASGNRKDIVTWNTNMTNSSTFHQVRLLVPQNLTEIAGQAEDATIYYAMTSNPNMTNTIDADTNSQAAFEQNGVLNASSAPSSGSIGDRKVFAFAVDLGEVTQTSAPIVWAIGMVRDPAILYQTTDGEMQWRSPYFSSEYSTTDAMIDAFLSDFDGARQRAVALDQRIQTDASSISPEYISLVSLAARQTIGATELTISRGSDGSWNTSDAKMFMKKVGSNGDHGAVNPVETLFDSFPFFLYLNATYAGYLLSPLLEYQDSPKYTQHFAAENIGSNYPKATGPDQSNDGVKYSGDMLIMSLAHARASGDGSFISRHYNLLRNWTDYLVSNSLTQSQQSSDQHQKVNDPNTSIKGIIGIKAMSRISQTLGYSNDSQKYASIASSLYIAWKSTVPSSSKESFTLDQNNTTPWNLIYNLYADVLLQTNVVDGQFRSSQLSTLKAVLQSPLATSFGLPVRNTSPNEAKLANSAWTMLTAATLTNLTVRNELITPIWTRASNPTSSGLFPLVYDLDSGATSYYTSSPAQGAMFAPLALQLPNKMISVPMIGESTKHVSLVGPLVGGILGGLALLALITLAAFFLRRRLRNRLASLSGVEAGEVCSPQPPRSNTPYSLLLRLALPSRGWSTRRRSESTRPPSVTSMVSGSGSYSHTASTFFPDRELSSVLDIHVTDKD